MPAMRPPFCRTLKIRHYAVASRAKKEGTIASVFASLSGSENVLPASFAALKRSIVTSDEQAAKLLQAWREVLRELETATAEIANDPDGSIPVINFRPDFELSSHEEAAIRSRGVAVVKGVVDSDQALEWKSRIRDYIKSNPQVKGFPEDNKQVFELYWSQSQVEARAHPSILSASTAFLQLFRRPTHPANADTSVSFDTPVCYADRLRIRLPGDNKFSLGAHWDSGGIERWEDVNYQAWHKPILKQGDWMTHDPFSIGTAGERLLAKTSMYDSSGQCSVFRPWQGWLSLSETCKNQGTLRVLPLLKLATCYIMLRPFFRPVHSVKVDSRGSAHSKAFLDVDNWQLDLDSSIFPGCSLGHTLEVSDSTHPHLRLSQTMTSIPRVSPGDMVFWHTDTIHSVEAVHNGKSDSSVLYIPGVPLTRANFAYAQRQRKAFEAGIPPEDFPGGDGEQTFTGRAHPSRISGEVGRAAMGFGHFRVPDQADAASIDLIKQCNAEIQ